VTDRVGCGWSGLARMPVGSIRVGWSACDGVRVMCVSHDRPSLQVVDIRVFQGLTFFSRSAHTFLSLLPDPLDLIPLGGGSLWCVRRRVCAWMGRDAYVLRVCCSACVGGVKYGGFAG
jgi:hypothetical protein